MLEVVQVSPVGDRFAQTAGWAPELRTPESLVPELVPKSLAPELVPELLLPDRIAVVR